MKARHVLNNLRNCAPELRIEIEKFASEMYFEGSSEWGRENRFLKSIDLPDGISILSGEDTGKYTLKIDRAKQSIILWGDETPLLIDGDIYYFEIE